MPDDLMRADAALAARGLVSSRERAQALIAAGLVTLNGRPLRKRSEKVSEIDALAVIGQDCPYVSRGGLKLEKALRVFSVDPSDLVCMDIGASTGGFTDVLLKNGARRVYAIDVGTGQLDARLAADPRVTSLEHVNARTLNMSMFDVPPVLGVMDVSFISIRLILPAALSVLGEHGRMITLIKPQFEAGRQAVGKGGIVSSAAEHIRVLREIVGFIPTLGWRVRGFDFSPITGGDGNIEFLADLTPSGDFDEFSIEDVVKRAHASIKGA